MEEAVEDMADERVGVISSLKKHYNDKPSGYIEEDTHIKVINTSGTINYKGKPIPFFRCNVTLADVVLVNGGVVAPSCERQI